MPDLRTDLEELRDAWKPHSLVGGAAEDLTALLAKHAAPAGPDLRAMVAELEAGKKWQNKLLDDIRALEADRDSWKKANERASLSSAESAAEVECLRDAMDDAFESGYIQGHTDTVESRYREPKDAAEDYRLSLAPLTAAEPAAPKEWRGPWKCTSSGRVYEPGEEWRHKNEGADECHGTLVPFERRKGGEG